MLHAFSIGYGSVFWNVCFVLAFFLLLLFAVKRLGKWADKSVVIPEYSGGDEPIDDEIAGRLAGLLAMYDGESSFVRNWLHRLRTERVVLELLWQQLEQQMARLRQDKTMYQLADGLDNWPADERSDGRNAEELRQSCEETRDRAKETFALFEDLADKIWLTLAEWHVAKVQQRVSGQELRSALGKERDLHAAAAYKYRLEVEYLRAELEEGLLERSNG